MTNLTRSKQRPFMHARRITFRARRLNAYAWIPPKSPYAILINDSIFSLNIGPYTRTNFGRRLYSEA